MAWTDGEMGANYNNDPNLPEWYRVRGGKLYFDEAASILGSADPRG
jgi:hypothetical protein